MNKEKQDFLKTIYKEIPEYRKEAFKELFPQLVDKPKPTLEKDVWYTYGHNNCFIVKFTDDELENQIGYSGYAWFEARDLVVKEGLIKASKELVLKT